MSNGPHGSSPGTRPSLFARRGPLIFASTAVALSAYFYYSKRPPLPEGTPTGIATPGVRNIEAAYTNAGATSTHTKAYGGTPLGDKNNENLRDHSPAGTGAPRGFSGEHFGDAQRPDDTTVIGKKWKQLQHGDEKGK